jgi:hypothetical protein
MDHRRRFGMDVCAQLVSTARPGTVGLPSVHSTRLTMQTALVGVNYKRVGRVSRRRNPPLFLLFVANGGLRFANPPYVLLEQKFHLLGNKSSICELQCESLLQEPGIPRWRDDDLTSNVFGRDARVDTLARRVGIVASRGSAR